MTRHRAARSHPRNFLFLLVFLLSTFLSPATAQKFITLNLTADRNIETIPLSLTVKETYEIDLKTFASGNILVEYIKASHTPRPGNIKLEPSRPHIILAAMHADQKEKDIFKTKDKSENPQGKDECTSTMPCFEPDNERFAVDEHSFLSSDDRYHVVLRNVLANDDIIISIHNYLRFILKDDSLYPQAFFNLRISLLDDTNMLCPGYVDDANSVCFGNGECVDKKCNCTEGYVGYSCRHKILDLSKRDEQNEQKLVLVPGTKWLGPPFANAPIVEIPPFQLQAFSWTQNLKSNRIYIIFRVLSGQPYSQYVKYLENNDATNPQATGTHSEAFWVMPEENAGWYPKEIPVVDDKQQMFFLRKYDEKNDGDATTHVNIIDKPLEENQAVQFVIYADPTNATESIVKPLVVSVEVRQCNSKDQPRCPYHPGLLIPIAVLPVCIVTIGLTAISVIIMLWLDRRHGFTSSVDKLTPEELDRMYPPEKLRDATARSPADITECLICLCEFERGDVVRKLHCEHFFHCECLDVSCVPNIYLTFCIRCFASYC